MNKRDDDLLIALVRDGFAGINTRLDTMNGRVRKNEEACARLDERVETLRSKNTAHAVTWGSVGSIAVSLAAAIAKYFGWLTP